MRGHTWLWDGWCTLSIPNSWNVDEGDGIITLAKTDGAGALQLSFAKRNKSEAVTIEESILLAKSFSDSCEWHEPCLQSITIHRSPATLIEHREQGVNRDIYWCVWCVLDQCRPATITYNCNWTDRGQEKRACNRIVASFKWL